MEQTSRSVPGFMPLKRKFDWRVFLVVVGAGMFGVVMIAVYSLIVTPDIAAALEALDVSIPPALLLTIQLIQNLVLIGILSALGLLAANQVGLGLPFVEGALNKESIWQQLPRIAGLAALIGIIGALVIAGLDLLVFARFLPENLSGAAIPGNAPNPLLNVLVSFYGGITEEVLLRLGVFSILVWLGSLASKTEEGRPTTTILWIMAVVAAVLFGVGHLPATAAAGIPLTFPIIVRAIVLNGLLGIAFAWLYWTRGLESAIISHFSADIILHVVLAALL